MTTRTLGSNPLILALLLGLAACGGADDDADSTPSSDESATSGPEQDASSEGESSGEDEDTSGDDAEAGAQAGVVSGVVEYAGSESGALVVGLYESCPPMGPPVGLKIEQVAEPVFPQAFELTEVDPGEYFIVAMLDVGSDSPTMPGPEDKMACSEAFELDETSGVELIINLVD